MVKVWDCEKGEQVRTITGRAGKQITRLLFIGKTPEFVTCSGDDQVQFLERGQRRQRRATSAAARDFLYAVGVSPDGAVVAAGGEEGVVRLYNGTTAS